MMEDQQQALSQSASVSRLDDTQSDDAQSVDARFFVAQAKSALSPEQYEQFVGILQDLRDSCTSDQEDVSHIRFLADSVCKIFASPDRYNLLLGFVVFIPPKHQQMYLKLVQDHSGVAVAVPIPQEKEEPAGRRSRRFHPPEGGPKARVASSLGRQLISTQPTSPAMSFGTTPRNRLHKQTFMDFDTEEGGRGVGVSGSRVNNMEDMPGGRGAEAMPGPLSYNTRDVTVGHAESRVPTIIFGSEVQRTNVAYISKAHSNSDPTGGHFQSYPGPGAHEAASSSMGAQQLSTQTNGPQFSFKNSIPTRREVQIKQRSSRAQFVSTPHRSTILLSDQIRSREMYEMSDPELPSPDSDEMKVRYDSEQVHAHAPVYSFPKNARVAAFFKRENQPCTEPQMALMKGTQSPGPRYFPSVSVLDSKKRQAPSHSFGISSTLRHSYLPAKATGRRPGGLAEAGEALDSDRCAVLGIESNMNLPGALGKQPDSVCKTLPSYSFSHSRRAHHSNERVFTGESVISNRRCVSEMSRKWNRRD